MIRVTVQRSGLAFTIRSSKTHNGVFLSGVLVLSLRICISVFFILKGLSWLRLFHFYKHIFMPGWSFFALWFVFVVGNDDDRFGLPLFSGHMGCQQFW